MPMPAKMAVFPYIHSASIATAVRGKTLPHQGLLCPYEAVSVIVPLDGFVE